MDVYHLAPSGRECGNKNRRRRHRNDHPCCEKQQYLTLHF